MYQASDSPVVSAPFMNYWRPILVFSNGAWNRQNLSVMSETETVKRGVFHKTHHVWQQPLDSWRYWLGGLTASGQLIADPFCGSGTNGVAVKNLGEGLRYLGTDTDEDTRP